MSAPAPVLAEKQCTKCGEVKPLTDFYRNRRTKDGRDYRCSACVLANTKAWQEQRRAVVGDEQWKAYKQDQVRRHRARGSSLDVLQKAAWAAAVRRLKEAHPDQFQQFYREERYERGLKT